MIPPFLCAVCGTPKRASNHWWEAIINEQVQTFRLYPWREGLDPQRCYPPIETQYHLCGQACVMKCLSEWMAKQQNVVPVKNSMD